MSSQAQGRHVPTRREAIAAIPRREIAAHPAAPGTRAGRAWSPLGNEPGRTGATSANGPSNREAHDVSPTRVSYSYQLFERCANHRSVIRTDHARWRGAAA